MSRTKLLAGLLITAILIDWVVTFFLYPRLPDRMPIHFDFGKPYPSYGPKVFFYLFPGVMSFFVILMFVLYPFRGAINFFGKRRLLRLPEAEQFPVFERAYQMVLMIGVFLVAILAYLQISVVQITFGTRSELMLWPLYVLFGAVVVYVIYDSIFIRQMIAAAESRAEPKPVRKYNDEID